MTFKLIFQALLVILVHEIWWIWLRNVQIRAEWKDLSTPLSPSLSQTQLWHCAFLWISYSETVQTKTFQGQTELGLPLWIACPIMYFNTCQYKQSPWLWGHELQELGQWNGFSQIHDRWPQPWACRGWKKESYSVHKSVSKMAFS